MLTLQVYSIRTRSRAVEIFTTCANLICAIEELEKVRQPQVHMITLCDGEFVCFSFIFYIFFDPVRVGCSQGFDLSCSAAVHRSIRAGSADA